MSCSSTYLSEKGWFKCLGRVEELWPGLLVWSEEHCDSLLNGQGWQRAGSVLLSEYPIMNCREGTQVPDQERKKIFMSL